MRFRRSPWLCCLTLLAGLTGCTNLPQAYCEVGGDCDDPTGLFFDPVLGSSSDSVGVCAVNVSTELSAYRANSEDICREVADAREAYLACVIEEGCDAFRLEEPECKDEYEDWQDLLSEAQNRCNE